MQQRGDEGKRLVRMRYPSNSHKSYLFSTRIYNESTQHRSSYLRNARGGDVEGLCVREGVVREQWDIENRPGQGDTPLASLRRF